MDMVTLNGRPVRAEKLLEPWLKRKDAARSDRRRFEPEWMTAQQFAAGRQWAAYLPHDHRMFVPPLTKGRSRQTADRLTQYIQTVVARLAADDFRGTLLPAQHGESDEDYAKTLDDLLAYGWDREWSGDERALKLCRTIAWLSTAAIRVRFDRTQGNRMLDVPHKDGKPILDPEQARKFTAEAQQYGENADIRSIREGRIVWDNLGPWNLLPPPGVEEAQDFPWELIVRPVSLAELRGLYPDTDIRADQVQSMDILGADRAGSTDVDASTAVQSGSAGAGRLEDHALVYTGYDPPSQAAPNGTTVVFTDGGALLDAKDTLPLPATKCRPARSGITYFHYWRVPGRFWGRALAAPGFGPQRLINKRLSQMDEMIDRGMAKVYVERGALEELPAGRVLEYIELEPGKAKPTIDPGIGPGSWFKDDIDMQDRNLQEALGVRDASLGENPTGVTTYAGLALLRQTDASKTDTIAQQLRLGLVECTYDSVGLMPQWPADKTLQIVGEDDTLRVIEFGQMKVPADYLVIPAHGSTQLRTEGAELQKVTDIWNAAQTSGLVARDPSAWVRWYVESLSTGKAQDIPEDTTGEQQHVAYLENELLDRSQNVPVAPFHDAAVHIPIHRADQAQWQQAVAQGVTEAAPVVMAYEQHILLHEQNAAGQQAPAQQGPQQPPSGPPLPPGLGAPQGPAAAASAPPGVLQPA